VFCSFYFLQTRALQDERCNGKAIRCLSAAACLLVGSLEIQVNDSHRHVFHVKNSDSGESALAALALT